MRFQSWWEATKKVGLIYTASERFFFVMRYICLSLRDWLALFIQKSTGEAHVKFHPIIKDVYALIFFVLMGVILPILLNKNVLSNPVGGGLLGVYLIAYVLQSEVNVVLFDQFRANKLPQRKQGGRGWGILCSIAKRILPTDPEKTEDEYKQTSFRRRLIISIMDYWLLFVAGGI